MFDIQLQPFMLIGALRVDASASDAQTRCCKHAPTRGRASVESENVLPMRRSASPCMSLDGVLTAARIASGM
jgi:hypothetical protein